MGAQVLCGFRVAFQKFTLRQSELLDEVVDVVFRVVVSAAVRFVAIVRTRTFAITCQRRTPVSNCNELITICAVVRVGQMGLMRSV